MRILNNSLNSLYNSSKKENKVLLFKQFEINYRLSKIRDNNFTAVPMYPIREIFLSIDLSVNCPCTLYVKSFFPLTFL